MKLIHLNVFLLFVFVPAILYGQNNKFPSSGSTGIGTTTPLAPLHILSNISERGLQINANSKNTTVYLHVAGADYGYLSLGGQTQIRGNGYHSTFEGNVGIGTTSPTHKLEVNGTIRAKELKLEATGWPDYVFEKGYDLMSLEEVKAHIDQKGHLPGLRPAKDYESGGVNIMDLNQKLLEKIEELTLYVIQQQQESASQMELIKHLKDRIGILEGSQALWDN